MWFHLEKMPKNIWLKPINKSINNSEKLNFMYADSKMHESLKL